MVYGGCVGPSVRSFIIQSNTKLKRFEESDIPIDIYYYQWEWYCNEEFIKISNWQ